MIYRHNIAHDGSVSRLLSILQVDVMVWVGMGSEVVFEVYSKGGYGAKNYIRILWGGQVLQSSNPTLGKVDMLDLDVFLAYIDGLVGRRRARWWTTVSRRVLEGGQKCSFGYTASLMN